jgi:putative membrane protein
MEKFKAKYLSPDQVAKITAAVQKAELKTMGELVPMIVKRSSAIGHVPYSCYLVLLSCSLMVFLSWEPQWALAYHWQILVALILLSFGLGTVLARLTVVQRWFVPEADEEAQVWQRAQTEWALQKVQKTESRTGILIFVSVMERKAVVLADEGIARHYKPETWQEIVTLLTRHLHRGEWVQGFEKAIERCGEILSVQMPAQSRNPNEIHDELIIKA